MGCSVEAGWGTTTPTAAAQPPHYFMYTIKKRQISILTHVGHVPSFLCVFELFYCVSTLLFLATKWMCRCRERPTVPPVLRAFGGWLLEVPERCKVQRGRVWSGLGDPAHVSLLMLSRGEVDTRPTGVTVPPPKSLWVTVKMGQRFGSFGLLFTSLSFVSCRCWPSTLWHTTLMWLTLLIFVISAWIRSF